MSKIGEAKRRSFTYCSTCKDYELKTSPHYRAPKTRFARRRKAEADKGQADK